MVRIEPCVVLENNSEKKKTHNDGGMQKKPRSLPKELLMVKGGTI